MGGFVRMPPKAAPKPSTAQPHSGTTKSKAPTALAGPQPSTRDTWSAAISGSAAQLPHQARMEKAFGQTLSRVRTYLGRREALNALNARAATDGERIAFASNSPSPRQVAHETAHVVQMGRGGAVADGSRLSDPGSPAEREADHAAERAGRGEPVSIAEIAPAQLHRDIKDNKLEVPHGTFKIDMTTMEVEGDWSGLDGTIHYMPNAKAPDSDSIRLSQMIKNTKVKTGLDVDISKVPGKENLKLMQTEQGDRVHVTVAGETLNSVSTAHFGSKKDAKQIGKNNEKLIRAAVPGALVDTSKPLPAGLALQITGAVAGGYSIDHDPSNPAAKKRTDAGDPIVPQDYVWPGEEVEKLNVHGSKKGKVLKEAVLSDGPSTKKSHLRWHFETVARSEDIGVYHGTVWWAFEVNGTVSPPKVSNETHGVKPGVSDTFDAALVKFNRFYANTHEVMAGETLKSISQLYFGKSDKADDIFKENKAMIGKRGTALKGGWKLRIPGVTDSLAKP